MNFKIYENEIYQEQREALNKEKEVNATNKVKILQQQLKMLNFYFGSITGSFGKATTLALKKFQKEQGLEETGYLDELTLKLLNDKTKPAEWTTPKIIATKPTLMLTDVGESVLELKKELKSLMYYDGDVDNVFDEKLQNAVKAFQLNNKQVADGIVGRHTWEILFSLYYPLVSCSE